jgi:hypothetical protein
MKGRDQWDIAQVGLLNVSGSLSSRCRELVEIVVMNTQVVSALTWINGLMAQIYHMVCVEGLGIAERTDVLRRYRLTNLGTVGGDGAK